MFLKLFNHKIRAKDVVFKDNMILDNVEYGTVNSYLSYYRFGKIVIFWFSKTYSSTSNAREIITSSLPFKCTGARNGISLLVATVLVGHASIYVSGYELGVNLSSYGAAVTAQGSIMCFIDE